MSLLTENYATRGFWGDEAWTALISRLSVPEIIQVTGQDFHPPLYYLLVHVFMLVFGESEAIRAISVFFWLLTLWPTYVLAGKLTKDKRLAQYSTLLVALSPILFTYAFEARAYALLTFLSVFSTLLFWNAAEEISSREQLKSKKVAASKPLKTQNPKFTWSLYPVLLSPWLRYALIGALGVYTHYYMWFILAAHGFYWLFFNRRQFWRVFFTYAGVVVVQLPWIPVLFGQLKSVAGNYWIGAIDHRTHWEYFYRIVGGDTDVWGRIVLAQGVLLIILLGTVLIQVQAWQAKKAVPKGYWFLLMWWLIPVLLPTILSFTYRPVFFYRYLVFTSIPILMLMVWSAQLLKKELLWAVVVIVSLLFVTTDATIFAKYPYSLKQEMMRLESENKKFEQSIQNGQLEYKIYTYLPAFAEVYYYTLQQHGLEVPVVVRPIGLVQASGQSLLNKYVERGEMFIAEPQPSENYWLIEPGPKSEFHQAE